MMVQVKQKSKIFVQWLFLLWWLGASFTSGTWMNHVLVSSNHLSSTLAVQIALTRLKKLKIPFT